MKKKWVGNRPWGIADSVSVHELQPRGGRTRFLVVKRLWRKRTLKFALSIYAVRGEGGTPTGGATKSRPDPGIANGGRGFTEGTRMVATSHEPFVRYSEPGTRVTHVTGPAWR